MPVETASPYSQLLENISNELDIPLNKFQQASNRYNSVSKWLKEGIYEGSTEPPEINLQGSFRLGTVVRPIRDGEESDYDIDLVCQLSNPKGSTPPSQIKRMVGDRLKENGIYGPMLEQPEGKRCWTLNYAEEDGIGFHMDILPSVEEDDKNINEIKAHPLNAFPHLADHAISITHKDSGGGYSRRSSNPKGYAEWFDEIKKPVFDSIKTRERQSLFEKNRTLLKTADEVPDQLIKTPLQRAIQILKRHRDERFAGDNWEEKPISMIITTLAAKIYRGEADIFSTLVSIIENLDAYSPLLDSELPLKNGLAASRLIERKQDGKWWIPNPVNPKENFADRWNENNSIKAKAFFKWVAWLRRDFVQVLDRGDIKTIGKSLEEIFGETIIRKASNGLYIAAAPAVVIEKKKAVHRVEINEPIHPYASNG